MRQSRLCELQSGPALQRGDPSGGLSGLQPEAQDALLCRAARLLSQYSGRKAVLAHSPVVGVQSTFGSQRSKPSMPQTQECDMAWSPRSPRHMQSRLTAPS